jgi:hypothetical protein
MERAAGTVMKEAQDENAVAAFIHAQQATDQANTSFKSAMQE